MVHSVIALRFLVPFKQREVDHPQTGEFLRITQSKTRTHFKTKFAKLLACLHSLAGKDQHEVTRFGIATFEPCADLIVSEELANRALD